MTAMKTWGVWQRLPEFKAQKVPKISLEGGPANNLNIENSLPRAPKCLKTALLHSKIQKGPN